MRKKTECEIIAICKFIYPDIENNERFIRQIIPSMQLLSNLVGSVF